MIFKINRKKKYKYIVDSAKILCIFLLILPSIGYTQEQEINTAEQFKIFFSSKLPGSWKILLNENRVIITKSEEVIFYNPVSRDITIPFDEFIEESGWKENLIICLSFSPKLSDNEYQKLLKIREESIDTLKEEFKKRPGKWSPEEVVNQKIKIPTYYNSKVSVYFEGFKKGFIADKLIEKEYQNLIKLINQVFKTY